MVALSKGLDELLSAAAPSAAEALQAGFARLLGELHALESRQLSQAKVGEELRSGLARLRPGADVQRELQEAEETYRVHIEDLAERDRQRVYRSHEVCDRAKRLAERAGELEEEAERLRRERLECQAEHAAALAVQASSGGKRLAALRAEIEDKTARKQQLEREMPGYLRVSEEHRTLTQRLAMVHTAERDSGAVSSRKKGSGRGCGHASTGGYPEAG